MPLSVVARRIHGSLLAADTPTVVGRIAPLDAALPGDLSFLPDLRYRGRLALCRASAAIVDRNSVPWCPVEPLIVDDIRIGCARAGSWLAVASRVNEVAQRPAQEYETVDPSASVASSAVLGRACTIGPRTVIGPGCIIGDGVRVGSYCKIGPHVTIEAAASLGNRVVVGANTSIGGEPFLYVRDCDAWLKLPSFGSVDIADDVNVGCNTVIDRGAIGDTRISSGVKIDSHVQIGHGVSIGHDTAIAAQCAIAGEARIGSRCTLGGAVAIGEGVEIVSRVRITAMSLVTKSLHKSDASYSSGWPVRFSRDWWRQVSVMNRRHA